ncbi:prefoldin subunit alpha [archaeon]|nr:prefoldin subunit alpha [archaeon]
MTDKQQQETQNLIAQQLMGQQVQQIEQQVATIGMQLTELEQLKENLIELKTLKNKKIHTPIGAGIFLESELKETNNVLLNVGANVIVKKDTDSAIKLLEGQVVELKKIQENMQGEYDKLVENLKGLH